MLLHFVTEVAVTKLMIKKKIHVVLLQIVIFLSTEFHYVFATLAQVHIYNFIWKTLRVHIILLKRVTEGTNVNENIANWEFR